MAKTKRGTVARSKTPSATAVAALLAPGTELGDAMTCTANFVSPVQRQVLPPAFGDALRMRGLDVNGPVAAGIIPGGVALAAVGNPLEAVVDTENTWGRGARLKVRFLDRQPDFRDQVETYVKLWEAAADVKFEFVPSGPAEIRITFKKTQAFFSLLGREGLRAPASEPTMSLGFRPGESDPDVFRRLVLHEFGHAIGFYHEHQNPREGIQWDMPVAIEYYRARLPAGMPTQQIVAQLTAVPHSSRYRASVFDPDSVMLYQIPKQLVRTGWKPEMMNNNVHLSVTDKALAAEIYGPGPGGPPVGGGGPARKLKVDGAAVSDSITAAGEVDRFPFEIKAQGTYQAEADGDALVRVTLADKTGDALPGFLPADSLTSIRGARLPFFVDAGEYTLLVTASEFVPGSRGSYRIRIVTL